MHHVGPQGETAPFTPRELAESVLAGPAYEPPYEGALQDEFAWHLVKYLREDLTLKSEVEVARPGALFAVDFVLDVPQPDGTRRRIGFECGGARGLRERDRQATRDAALVASGAVDVLYRLRGTDLLHHMEDCLWLVSEWEAAEAAGPFSERGRINLRTLASPEAKALRLRPEQPSVMVAYAVDPEADDPDRHLWHVANGVPPFVLVRRFDRRFPDVWGPLVESAPADARPTRALPLRKAS